MLVAFLAIVRLLLVVADWEENLLGREFDLDVDLQTVVPFINWVYDVGKASFGFGESLLFFISGFFFLLFFLLLLCQVLISFLLLRFFAGVCLRFTIRAFVCLPSDSIGLDLFLASVWIQLEHPGFTPVFG